MNSKSSKIVELHTLVGEVLQKWMAFVEVEFDQKENKLKGNWDAVRSCDELKEALEIDETGLTACFLLRAKIEEVLKINTVSYFDFVNDREGTQKKIQPLVEMTQMIDQGWVKEEIDEFIQTLKTAVGHYGIDVGTWKEFEDRVELAYLRRDAFKSFENLRKDQFSFGEWDNNEVRYNEKICQFWNVKDLVAGMGDMPVSGVTLCVLRDRDDPVFSFFVFGIRNGGNIILLTDRSNLAHPLQKYMTRNHGRMLEARMVKNHFPYDLIGAKFVNSKEHARLDGIPGLIKPGRMVDAIGKFNEMQPDQIIWAVMILDKIREKFWYGKTVLAIQSFTGDMIEKPRALLEQIEHLPVLRKEVLEMPRLTNEDISREKLEEEKNWKRESTRFNEWLVERYKSKVDEKYLNLVEKPKNLLENPDKDEEFDDFGHEIVKVEDKLRAISPEVFGSKQEIVKDYKWFARFNLAVIVQDEAEKEFEKEKENVLAWYREAVTKNLARLEASIGRGEFISIDQEVLHDFEHPFGADWGKIKDTEKNILKVRLDDKYSYYKDIVHFGKVCWEGYFCYKTGKASSVFVSFEIDNPKAIADVCGCQIKDLPVFLQNYYKQVPYDGNCILDRLDPVDWKIHNPWKALDLDVVFFMTKNVYNGLRKAQGKERFLDWGSMEKK